MGNAMVDGFVSLLIMTLGLIFLQPVASVRGQPGCDAVCL